MTSSSLKTDNIISMLLHSKVFFGKLKSFSTSDDSFFSSCLAAASVMCWNTKKATRTLKDRLSRRLQPSDMEKCRMCSATEQFTIIEEQKPRLLLGAAFSTAPCKACYGNTPFRNLSLLFRTVTLQITRSLFVFWRWAVLTVLPHAASALSEQRCTGGLFLFFCQFSFGLKIESFIILI